MKSPKKTYSKKIKGDHSLHEVFLIGDDKKNIRVFFDVDYVMEHTHDPWNAAFILTSMLSRLNRLFGTTDSDWAIAQCHRTNKVSFHILSRKYCCPVTSVLDIYKQVNLIFVDSILLSNASKFKKLRLPNQSKIVDGKWVASPMHIVQGELSDFLISDTVGLTLLPDDAVSADTSPNSR